MNATRPAPLVGEPRGSTWRPALALFAILLACSAYFFPRWADWNQNSRFDLVLALVDDGTVAIDKYVSNTGDYALFRGHHYSDKAPGMALLGVPVYATFRALLPAHVAATLHTSAAGNNPLRATLREGGAGLQPDRFSTFLALAVTTFITVAVPSAAAGVIVFALTGHLGGTLGERWATALLYGLGTSAFPYANAFVGHQTGAFLLLAAFGLLLAARRGVVGRRWLMLVGLLIGYAFVTEYPTALIGVLLGVYAMWTLGQSIQTLLLLALGAAPALAILAAYDLATFGTVLPVGYRYSALWTEVHGTGFLSLTYPRLDALWGLTFGVHRGLFFLSPYLIFAAAGYVRLWRARPWRAEFWVMVLSPLLFFLFNASSAMWSGGFGVGPRYLVPSLPYLAIAAGLGAGSAWRRLSLRPLVVLAAAWSLVAVWSQTIGGQSFPDYSPNPLFDLSLPRLAAGDIARNAGMMLGLSAWASLAPLAGLVALAGLFAWRGVPRPIVAMRLPPRQIASRRPRVERGVPAAVAD